MMLTVSAHQIVHDILTDSPIHPRHSDTRLLDARETPHTPHDRDSPIFEH